jgi:endonuclease I
MKWHLEEPVSESEIRRNEAVFKIQGNRNPFIDVPDYACKIYARDGQNYNSEVANVCTAK